MELIKKEIEFVKCTVCEKDILCTDQDPSKVFANHLKESKYCNEWINADPLYTNVINKIINNCYVQLKDNLKCNNCATEYSNIGNLNKHFKTHPECIKQVLYKIIKEDTVDDTVDDTEKYYKNWPNSEYNKDLALARDKAIDYITNYCMSIQEKIRYSTNDNAVIFDLDDTLIFGDPSGTIGIREMELGKDDSGNDIFILPANKEIVQIANKAAELGYKIIIWSCRPNSSLNSSYKNLEFIGIKEYEFYNGNEEPDYKKNILNEIKKKYNVVMTIGDEWHDCYRPCFLKLPTPTERCIQVNYSPELSFLANLNKW